MRKTKAAFLRSRLTSADIPAKKLWSLLAERTGFHLRGARLKAAFSTQALDGPDAAQSFQNFFMDKLAGITQRLSTFSQQATSPTDANMLMAKSIMFIFRPVMRKEVVMHLSRLRKKTSPNDAFPNRLLGADDSVTDLFVAVCNTSFEEGHFPIALKEVIIIPVLKKPQLEPSVLGNYRPVSNLHLPGKLIECIAAARLSGHLSNKFPTPQSVGV